MDLFAMSGDNKLYAQKDYEYIWNFVTCALATLLPKAKEARAEEKRQEQCS